MREWGGRGCGSGPSERVGRSGIRASEWAQAGKEVGEKMRAVKKDGHCIGSKRCQYWGVNAASLAQLEAKWGKVDDQFIERNSGCCLIPEDWRKHCPVAETYK